MKANLEQAQIYGFNVFPNQTKCLLTGKYIFHQSWLQKMNYESKNATNSSDVHTKVLNIIITSHSYF